MSMTQLAETIRELVGSRSDLVFAPLPENDPLLRRPDLTVIRRELGYEPVVTPAEGLARTIADVAERLGVPLAAG
jgi:nucleoside-diphosphate-sugar epimerase